MQKILQTSKLAFHYPGEKNLFSSCSLELLQGDFISLFGENGKGKTTLIKLLLGLLTQSSGEITWFQKDGTQSKKCPYSVEYISQQARGLDTLIPMSVEEVMYLASKIPKNSKKIIGCSYETIDSALKHVGMLEYKKKLFRELSGGQQQRVLIAKALLSRPEILILDEPTVGIDFVAQKHLYTLLKHLNTAHNITILLITHDTQFIEDVDLKIWYVGQVDCDECHNEKIHLFQIKKMFPKQEVHFLS